MQSQEGREPQSECRQAWSLLTGEVMRREMVSITSIAIYKMYNYTGSSTNMKDTKYGLGAE